MEKPSRFALKGEQWNVGQARRGSDGGEHPVGLGRELILLRSLCRDFGTREASPDISYAEVNFGAFATFHQCLCGFGAPTRLRRFSTGCQLLLARGRVRGGEAHFFPQVEFPTVQQFPLHLQRLYGLAVGDEDIHNHERLRLDHLLAVACDKRDPLTRTGNVSLRPGCPSRCIVREAKWRTCSSSRSWTCKPTG